MDRLLIPRRTTAAFGAVIALTSSLFIAASVSTTESGHASGISYGATYVALGDSYSSGEGLGPFEDGTGVNDGPYKNTCHRSEGHAYADLSPAVVLPSVSNRGFWACSGATVKYIENTPGTNGTPNQYGEDAQIDRVTHDTKYITLSVGGDDLGFSDIGHACAEYDILNHKGYVDASKSCKDEVSFEEAKMASLETDLTALYESLLDEAAPGAELVVAGYPKVLPSSYPDNLRKVDGTRFCTFDHVHGLGSIGMPLPDAKRVSSFIAQLNGTVQSAVAAAGQDDPGQIRYADIYPTSVPRNCKGTTPSATVTGFEVSPGCNGIGWHGCVSSATFHPTKAGQKVYAEAIQSTFKAFKASRKSIAFDSSPGTDPPPDTLGGRFMNKFDDYFYDQDDTINSLLGPDGAITFSDYGTVKEVGDGWNTWSQDYSGDVIAFGEEDEATSVTIYLPSGTTAFYMYLEPDEYADYDMTVSANNGTTSGDETVYGDSGASYFGFYSTDGTPITSIRVSASDDFAIGQLAISNT